MDLAALGIEPVEPPKGIDLAALGIVPVAPRPSTGGVEDWMTSYEDPGAPQPDLMAWQEDPANNPAYPGLVQGPAISPEGPGVDPYGQNPYDFMQSTYQPRPRDTAPARGSIPAVGEFLGQYGQEKYTDVGIGHDGKSTLKYPQPEAGRAEYNKRKKADEARIKAAKKKYREEYADNFGIEKPDPKTMDPFAADPYGLKAEDMPALTEAVAKSSKARKDKKTAKMAADNVRKMEREYLAGLRDNEIPPEDRDRAMFARIEYYENLPLKMSADVFSDPQMRQRYQDINEMILGAPLVTTDPMERAGRQVKIDRMRQEFQASGAEDPIDWYMEQEAKSAGNIVYRSGQAFKQGVGNTVRGLTVDTGDMVSDLTVGAIEGLTGYEVPRQGNLGGNRRVREMAQGWNEGVQQKADEQGNLGGFATGALRGTAGVGGEMAPLFLGGAATGLGGGLVIGGMGLNVGSRTYNTLRTQGWDRDEALLYAGGASAIEVATERLGVGVAKTMGWVNLEGAFTKQARETFAQAMKRPGIGKIMAIAGSAFGEGFEEIAAEVGGSIHDAMWGLDPSLFGSKPGATQVKELAKVFTIGALAGLGGNLPAAMDFILDPSRKNAESLGLDTKAFNQKLLESIAEAAKDLMAERLAAKMAEDQKPTTGQDAAGQAFAQQAWAEVNGEAPPAAGPDPAAPATPAAPAEPTPSPIDHQALLASLQSTGQAPEGSDPDLGRAWTLLQEIGVSPEAFVLAVAKAPPQSPAEWADFVRQVGRDALNPTQAPPQEPAPAEPTAQEPEPAKPTEPAEPVTSSTTTPPPTQGETDGQVQGRPEGQVTQPEPPAGPEEVETPPAPEPVDAEHQSVIDLVNKALPDSQAKVEKGKDDYSVSFPNGTGFRLKKVDTIPATDEQIGKALADYQIKDTPENREAMRKTTKGTFRFRSKDGAAIIHLKASLDSDTAASTLRHEAVHFARRSGLINDAEWESMVEKIQKGASKLTPKQQEEVVARYIQKNKNSSVGARIKEVLTKILEVMGIEPDAAAKLEAAMRTGSLLAKPDKSWRANASAIPAGIEVEVEAIKLSTGERVKTKQDAKEAYTELDADADLYKKLLACLSGKAI